MLLHGTSLAGLRGMTDPLSSASVVPALYCVPPTSAHIAVGYSTPFVVSRDECITLEHLHRRVAEELGAVVSGGAVNDDAVDFLRLSTRGVVIEVLAVVEALCDLRGTILGPDDGPPREPPLSTQLSDHPVCYSLDGAMSYAVPWSRIVDLRGVLIGTQRQQE